MAKRKNKSQGNKATNDDSGNVRVEYECAWIIDIPDEELNNRYVKKIVNFYLFHTPVQDISALSRSLSSYGWTNPWNAPEYLNSKMCNATTNDDFLIVAERMADMREILQSAKLIDIFPETIKEEKACIYPGNNSHYYSILEHIRNSLAHGRFRIIRKGKGYDIFYLFEDINTSRKVSARMVIKQTTLLNWIEIIEKGP